MLTVLLIIIVITEVLVTYWDNYKEPKASDKSTYVDYPFILQLKYVI